MWTEWYQHTATERFIARMNDDIARASEALISPDTSWEKVHELRGRITALRSAIDWAKERSKESDDGSTD